MKVHLSAMLPTRMVVDAAQNTQYHRKRAFPYGTDETSLRAKSAFPMKPVCDDRTVMIGQCDASMDEHTVHHRYSIPVYNMKLVHTILLYT